MSKCKALYIRILVDKTGLANLSLQICNSGCKVPVGCFHLARQVEHMAVEFTRASGKIPLDKEDTDCASDCYSPQETTDQVFHRGGARLELSVFYHGASRSHEKPPKETPKRRGLNNAFGPAFPEESTKPGSRFWDQDTRHRLSSGRFWPICMRAGIFGSKPISALIITLLLTALRPPPPRRPPHTQKSRLRDSPRQPWLDAAARSDPRALRRPQSSRRPSPPRDSPMATVHVLLWQFAVGKLGESEARPMRDC